MNDGFARGNPVFMSELEGMYLLTFPKETARAHEGNLPYLTGTIITQMASVIKYQISIQKALGRFFVHRHVYKCLE